MVWRWIENSRSVKLYPYADPSRKGPVINILPPVGGVDRYQVYHSPTEIREYRADQIVLVDISPASDPLRDAIAQNDWRKPEEFLARPDSHSPGSSPGR